MVQRRGAFRHIRWPLFASSLGVTAVSLGLYFRGIPGHEIYLFVAGVTGGAVLAEIAAAQERRDLRADNDALRQQLEELRVGNLNIFEPMLAAAVDVGLAFAQVNTDPNMLSATMLGVAGELAAAADKNDIHGICKALRIRHGEAASESFLLGRQLTLLMVADEITSATRDLVRQRLLLRVNDPELARVVDAVLSLPPAQLLVNGENGRLPYLANLVEYLRHSTTTNDARSARARLLQGLVGVSHDGNPSESSALGRMVSLLVEKRLDEHDAELLLWRGLLEHDDAMVHRAKQMKADPTITTVELARRHRSVLQAEDPELYRELTGS
jgi:hypothetical protein